MMSIINIAFYLSNKRIADVNCRNIEKGNPGIGGTYFSMIALAYFLSKNPISRYKITLIADSVKNLPEEIECIEQSSKNPVQKILKEKEIDIIVINDGGKDTFSINLLSELSNLDVKLVIWAHSAIPTKKLRIFHNNKNVFQIVCVGKEQLYTYCDHQAFNKSTYIFNGYFFNKNEKLLPYNQRNNDVVYVGGILAIKGFHILAKAWKSVSEKIPDARLIVIGSGNLYNKKMKMGTLGIADIFYEKYFMKYLTDAKGNILDSVKFLGILGIEKFDYLKNAKVGVPNPGGIPETFCYTAVEMQASGMLVTSKINPGFADTVSINGGILYRSPDDLAENIIKLLQKKDYNPDETISYLENNFSYEIIAAKWLDLFDNISDNKVSTIQYSPRFIIRNSELKDWNRKLKRVLPFGYMLPSVKFYEEIFGRMRYYFGKIIDIRNTVHKLYLRMNDSEQQG